MAKLYDKQLKALLNKPKEKKRQSIPMVMA